jgi:hypothetical protein
MNFNKSLITNFLWVVSWKLYLPPSLIGRPMCLYVPHIHIPTLMPMKNWQLFYNHKKGGISLSKFGLWSKLAIEVFCNEWNEVACTQEVLGREERERTTLLDIYI